MSRISDYSLVVPNLDLQAIISPLDPRKNMFSDSSPLIVINIQANSSVAQVTAFFLTMLFFLRTFISESLISFLFLLLVVLCEVAAS